MYALRRLALFVPVWIGVAVLTFAMMRLIGGDPAQALYGGGALSVAALQEVHHRLGLDRPLLVQLGAFLFNAVRGNFGDSWQSGTAVGPMLAQRFPYTLELALTGLGLGTAAGLVLGIIAAVRQGSSLDRALLIGSLLLLSVPGFWLGILLIYLFSVHLGWLPVAGAVGWQSLVMPAGVLAATGAPIVARVARAGMLEVLRTEYIRTARAKGLGERMVLLRHALRNALNPIVTIVGLLFGNLLGGAIIVEQVFSRPGIGTLAVQAIFARDYPLIQGIVLYTSTVFLILNLVVDLSYTLTDPRVRFD
ncbi:MAG TPA: ABC transporter permease [bacterium]|nr:ABC transporter permease [bacterium]